MQLNSPDAFLDCPTREQRAWVGDSLGVTPAEPGYASARVAPRLGTLAWAEGTVPTPHGPIHVRAEKERVTIDSPVPVRVDLPEQVLQSLPAGQHTLAVET